MYNEIWKSVEALFKPPHRMSDIVAIPDLTFDLIGLLRITLNDSQFSDTSKYKRVIKQEFAHPMYQIVNIVFDFDNHDQNPIMLKILYEGKFTLFTIIPFDFITDKYSLNGIVPKFMFDFLTTSRQLIRAMSESAFTESYGNAFLDAINLHSIPLLFTKWMVNEFGVDKSVRDIIIKTFEDNGFPAIITPELISLYVDLFANTSVEKLLDHGYIATEADIIYNAYNDKIKTMKTDISGDNDEKDIQTD